MNFLRTFAVVIIWVCHSRAADVKCYECSDCKTITTEILSTKAAKKCKTETTYDKLYVISKTVRSGVDVADCTAKTTFEVDGSGKIVSCCEDSDGCNKVAAQTSFQYCYKCDACNEVQAATDTSYDAANPVCKMVAMYSVSKLTETKRIATTKADCIPTESSAGSGEGYVTTCCSEPGCNKLSPAKTLFPCYSCSGATCNSIVSGTTQTARAATSCQTKSTYVDYKLINVVRVNLFNDCVSQDNRVKGSGTNVECCKDANCNNATKEDMPSLNCYVCSSCNAIASDTFTSNVDCVACTTNTNYANQVVTSTSRSCSTSPCSPAEASGGTGTKVECCSTNLCNKESKHALRMCFNSLLISGALLIVLISISK